MHDAKRAVEEHGRSGIVSFCIGLDPEAGASIAHVFGASRYLLLDHLHRLPQTLSLLYLRWAHS